MTDAAERTEPRRQVDIFIHCAVAALVTWPLVLHLGDGLAQGREPVAAVPNFNLWSLQWTARNLPLDWRSWWDAPIFAPLAGSYARSELQPLTGLAFGLLNRLVSAPAAYNLLLLIALMLNGLAVAGLARRLGATPVAATVAGILAQLSPFLHQQMGVLQLMMIWPVVGTVERLLAWTDSGRPGHAAQAGGLMALGYLTCSYHAALGGLCLLLAAPLLVARSWRCHWRRRVGGLLAGVAVFAAIALPFAVTQAHHLGNTVWTRQTIMNGSARWHEIAPGGDLWPGWVVLGCATAGLALGRRRRSVTFVAALAALATLLSVGSNISLFGFRPWEWLGEHVAVVARMRSPFRAVAFAQMLWASLAGLALSKLTHSAHLLHRAAASVIAAAVIVLAPIGAGDLTRLPASDDVWAEWLRGHPGGTVAMLPMPTQRPVEALLPTTEWMLIALDHGHPLLNGYTGFFPDGDRDLRLRLANFPSTSTIAELRDRGVRYVVADSLWWDSRRDTAARRLGVNIVLGGPDGVLLDLAETSS